MTQTFTTDSQNDILLGRDGNLSISTGIQGVLQACATAAKAQLGEMALATRRGIPNFQTVWSSGRNLSQFESYLRATLSGVFEVTGIKELTLALEGSVLKYSATIETVYGTGDLNG